MGLATLITLLVVWLSILTLLVLNLAGIAGRQFGTSWRWMAVGLLLLNGAAIVTMFAQFRGWTSDRVHALSTITMPAIVAGVAVIVLAAMLRTRERGKARRVS